MNHACPVCKKDIARKKLGRKIVAAMAIDCPHCQHKIHLNIHRAEGILVVFNFILIVVLGVFAWWLQSRGLMLATLGAIMAGALALPFLENVWLREWPRYGLPPDAAAAPQDGNANGKT